MPGHYHLEMLNIKTRFLIPLPPRIKEETDRLALHRENADLRQENAQLKRELREMTRIAYTDSLTNTFNRLGIMNAFTNTLQGDEGALYLIDLDKFKPINDTFGHDAGDEALKLVGKTLKKLCRSNDLIGRLGGDEFIIVLDDITPEEAAVAMKKFENAFNSMSINAIPFEGDPTLQTIQIQGSIGVAPFKNGDDFTEVYKQADADMFKKKSMNPTRNR